MHLAERPETFTTKIPLSIIYNIAGRAFQYRYFSALTYSHIQPSATIQQKCECVCITLHWFLGKNWISTLFLAVAGAAIAMRSVYDNYRRRGGHSVICVKCEVKICIKLYQLHLKQAHNINTLYLCTWCLQFKWKRSAGSQYNHKYECMLARIKADNVAICNTY